MSLKAEWLEKQKEKARAKFERQRREAEEFYREQSKEQQSSPSQEVPTELDDENILSSPVKLEGQTSPSKRERISKSRTLNMETWSAVASPAPVTPCVADTLGESFWTPHREATPKVQTPVARRELDSGLTPRRKAHLTRWVNSGLACGGISMLDR